MYDFQNDVWLCHSAQGTCYNFTAFVSAWKVTLLCSIYNVRHRSLVENICCVVTLKCPYECAATSHKRA